MARLSIITVNLNNASGLCKTIESVVIQTFGNYEYIIIDGGSSDDSVALIKQNEDQIAYWLCEPDSGIYNAMNKGIGKATGEYCLFLNSGDYLINSNVLSEVFSSNFNEDIVYCDLNIDGAICTYPDKLSLLYFFQSTLGHPSTLIKKELFNKYGLYNEANKILSDREFFINVIINHKCTYRHLKNIVISHFNTEGISSKDRSLVSYEYETILRRMYPDVYDDYIEYVALKSKLDHYENSISHQIVTKIHKLKIFHAFKKIMNSMKKIR